MLTLLRRYALGNMKIKVRTTIYRHHTFFWTVHWFNIRSKIEQVHSCSDTFASWGRVQPSNWAVNWLTRCNCCALAMASGCLSCWLHDSRPFGSYTADKIFCFEALTFLHFLNLRSTVFVRVSNSMNPSEPLPAATPIWSPRIWN